MRKLFYALIVLPILGLGQVSINMTDGSYTFAGKSDPSGTCQIVFYDSGGSQSDYQEGESYEYTVCADAGETLTLDFSSVTIGSSDVLEIYDGSSATGMPIHTVTGPTTVVSSQSCVTIKFQDNCEVGTTVGPCPFCTTICSRNDVGSWVATITASDCATCSDGELNGDETGVDCGGCNCIPCGTNGGGTGNLDVVSNVPALNCGGGEVVLTATGVAPTPLINNDFNCGDVGNGWAFVGNAMFDNPCGTGPNGSNDPHIWYGDGTPNPRDLATQPLDMPCGGIIEFDMRMSYQGDMAPCEGPDEPDEGVFIQYSIDGGNSWITIDYFDPDGGTSAYTDWQSFSYELPPGAHASDIVIRWHQDDVSGPEYDHWGMDNIVITPYECDYYVDWLHIPGYPDDIEITEQLDETTTFEVIYTNGIDDTAYATITIPVGGMNTPVVTPQDLTCELPSQIDVEVDGGTAPYTVSINGPTNNTQSGTQQNYSFTNVSPGNYVVTVEDNNNCSIPVNVAVQDFSAGIESTDTVMICEGESVRVHGQMVSAEGLYTEAFPISPSCDSTSNVQVLFAPSGDPSISTDKLVYCSSEGTIQVDIDGTPGGSFSSTAIDVNPLYGTIDLTQQQWSGNGTLIDITYLTSDANSCAVSETITLTVYPSPSVPVPSNMELCSGEVFNDYTFVPDPVISRVEWTATGNVTGLPASGIGTIPGFTASNSGTTPQVSTIDVQAFGNGNCASPLQSFDVVVNPLPSLTAGPDIVSCAGDNVVLTASSSTTGTYLWTPGGLTGDQVQITPPSSLSDTITTSYIVSFTDALTGCEVRDEISVIVEPCVCTFPNIVAIPDTVLCEGEQLDLDDLILASSDMHEGSWHSSATDALNDVGEISSTLVTADGDYYYRYHNIGADTCGSVFSTQVRFAALPTPQIEVISVSCDGQDFFVGELSGYPVYQWSTGETSNGDSVSISDGSISLYVEDENGCSATTTFVPSPAEEFNLQVASSLSPTCPGTLNGSIVIAANGGASIQGVDYEWSHSNEVYLGTENGLDAGIYEIIGTDANGCKDTVSVVLLAPDTLRAEVNTVDAVCAGDANGQAEVVNVTGNVGNVTYIWSTNLPNTNSVSSVDNLYAGNHAVQLFDENGCNFLVEFPVNEPEPLSFLSFGVDSLSYCRGSGAYPGTGYISGIGQGGVGTLSYDWKDEQGNSIASTATAQDLVPGNYSLTITDANGCMYSESLYLDSINPYAHFTVTPDRGEAPLDVTIVDVSGGLAQNGVLYWTLDVENNTGNYTTTINSQQDTVYNDYGEFTIRMIAENGYGCRDTVYRNVIVYQPLDIKIPNVFTPDGDGHNDVFYIPAAGWREFEMVIFNRWGDKIFTTNDPNVGWNGETEGGQEASEGVYLFTYKIVGQNPEDIRDGRGNIHLLR